MTFEERELIDSEIERLLKLKRELKEEIELYEEDDNTALENELEEVEISLSELFDT